MLNNVFKKKIGILLIFLGGNFGNIEVGNGTRSVTDIVIKITSELNSVTDTAIREKIERIKEILDDTISTDNTISEYRRNNMYEILFGGVDTSSSSVSSLLSSVTSYGFEGSPIGMATVHSRLNEVLDLIVRSLITDTIGDSSDTALQDGSTIWSKYNFGRDLTYSTDLSTYSTSNEPFPSFLNFIKNQILGLASIIDLSTLTNIKVGIEEIFTGDFSIISTIKLKTIYNYLLALTKSGICNTFNDASLDPSGPLRQDGPLNNLIAPDDGTNSDPTNTGYSIEDQHNNTVNMINIKIVNDNSDLISLSNILRSANYIFPLIINRVIQVGVSDEEKKILIGKYVQPGLTLMNCLHDIRKEIYVKPKTTDLAVINFLKKYPAIGLISYESSSNLFNDTSIQSTPVDGSNAKVKKAVEKVASQCNSFFARSFTTARGSITSTENLVTTYQYNFERIVPMLLYPNSYTEKQKWIELFAVPLIKKIDSSSENEPWFSIGNSGCESPKKYFKKVFAECALYIGIETVDGISNLLPLPETTDPLFGLLETLLNDPLLANYVRELKESNIITILQDARIPVNLGKIFEKLTAAKNATDPGLSSDHPADITKWGNINGVWFECGAQLLLNYIGNPSDPGNGTCETLYSLVRRYELQDLTNITNANNMRQALGDLIGAIRYKYMECIYQYGSFDGILNALKVLRVGFETSILAGTVTGNLQDATKILIPNAYDTGV
ncbi:MAG: hypothetical protein LBS83_02065 [Holosporales bacterium]|jgi:hypothetical protein|nr:hypothetical protein [Holosporales bacterium]